ncbi:hypothetical protein LEP1GSC043_0514 [Leptospira weilii str. Ecochallenge]|uniref:Uncharacterized protein n=2 Tax=Leptospira weilii TaxID=28184 RepID=N1UFE9_9LEPT|nr:hypothetical protein LEP1GSC051_0172 [Leptospira sp. P2653]EMN43736.1 hypothetical protein LEP1GSC086_4499 [Leptospira weilii str. LNT 1234]EMN90195.1 hypothetical protein LEP1GSC108_4847 [Leptospira weilii str. UI 13098]EMY14755.1 hypothetical protein LEP1GSC043_0514 [Leptospira weilii str. Ecochallenge]
MLPISCINGSVSVIGPSGTNFITPIFESLEVIISFASFIRFLSISPDLESVGFLDFQNGCLIFLDQI